jgi:hypothetical protein
MSTFVSQQNDSYFTVSSSDTTAYAESDDSIRWHPSEPCDWSPEIQRNLLHFFLKCEYPFRKILDIPLEEPLRSEVRRFFISLDAYIESPNPVMKPRDILFKATEIDYAAYLKKVKRKSFETSWNAKHFAKPDWWDDVPFYYINDIGQIFNYSYTIHWKTEDDTDWEYGLIDVPKDVDLTEFKSALRRILPEGPISKIADFDILCKISSSRAFNSKTHKKDSHYLLKPKRLYFSKERNLSCRSIIDVGPANKRDSILVDPADLNTINFLDSQIGEILKKMGSHIHLRDSGEIDRRLRKFARKYDYFLQRDIRKEGITKPFYITGAILEVLDEQYPELNIGRFKNFYDSFDVLIDKRKLSMKRGHGLGMANSITTIMNLVIHELSAELSNRRLVNFECDCLALNDDFVVGFEEDDSAEEYWNAEDEIMSYLGILRSPEKSFMTESRFTIAERYFFENSEHKKESYVLRELYLPLAASTIAQAKEAFASTQVTLSHERIEVIMKEIIDYWGYEFFEKESLYPFLCGGWYNPHFKGVDLSLVYLEDLPFNQNVSAAIVAVGERPHFDGDREIYRPPSEILMGSPNIPKEFHERLLMIPIDEINQKFYLARNIETYVRYYTSLGKKRKKKYKQRTLLSYQEALKYIIKHNETKSFYPNGDMVQKYAVSDQYEGNFSDPYLDPNPYLAMVAKYTSINYHFKEEYSFICRGNDALKIKNRALSEDMRWALWSSLMDDKFDEVDCAINIPRDYSPEEDYLEPVKIGICSSTLYLNAGYPVLKPEFRSPLIEKKKEVFGRLLSINELVLIEKYQIEREMIKSIVDLGYEFTEENILMMIDVIREYEGTPIVKTPSPQLEEKDRLITVDRLLSDKDILINWYDDDTLYEVECEQTREILSECRGLMGRLLVYSDSEEYEEKKTEIIRQLSVFTSEVVKVSSIEEYFDKRHLEANQEETEEAPLYTFYDSDSYETDDSDGSDES